MRKNIPTTQALFVCVVGFIDFFFFYISASLTVQTENTFRVRSERSPHLRNLSPMLELQEGPARAEHMTRTRRAIKGTGGAARRCYAVRFGRGGKELSSANMAFGLGERKKN